MDRLFPTRNWVASFLAVCVVATSTGCSGLLVTALYLVKGYDIPADYKGLEKKRVVVFCSPPASLEYRYAGADRELAKRVGILLQQNVKGIDVVNPAEVENWTDERDMEDVTDLAKAVKADMVVHVELEDFNLQKGSTLYQGQANVVLKVLDMQDGGREAYEKNLNQILYPINSGVPAQEKPIQVFRRQYISVLAEHIAKHFYKHDPHMDFATDTLAHY